MSNRPWLNQVSGGWCFVVVGGWWWLYKMDQFNRLKIVTFFNNSRFLDFMI